VIVVTSRIRVRRGNADALAARYADRLGMADGADGCLGIEILRGVDRPDEFMVYSRWESADAYERYRASDAFRAAHERVRLIPGGIAVERVDEGTALFEVLS
jgi:heme-degrading monooxygenase HmoA